MLMYRREKGRGWCWARASPSEAPPRTARGGRRRSRAAARTGSARPGRQARGRAGRPASTNVASCWVNATRSRLARGARRAWAQRGAAAAARRPGARPGWDSRRPARRRSTTARASGASMTPSMGTALPVRGAVGEDRHARSSSWVTRHDLRHRRDPGARLGPAVLAQRDHAARDRVAAELARRRPRQDQLACILGEPEQLVDPGAAAIAGAAALVATRAARERDARGVRDAEREQIGGIGMVGTPARGADAAHEPLGEHALEHRAYEIGLAAHVLEPRHRAGGIIGVQGREDEVAGERGLDGDLRRLAGRGSRPR